MIADMHNHSTASDGSMTPRELVNFAHENGIDIMAITDHDTVSGVEEGATAAAEINAKTRHGVGGITFVRGIEFSTFVEKDGYYFKAHILGYNVDGENLKMKQALADGVRFRAEKLVRRLKYLEDTFGIKLSSEEIQTLKSYKTVGKIHLAHVLIQHGYGVEVQDTIKKYMSDPRFPEALINSKQAIEAILSCGGTPVIAHPLGGEGEKHITREEVSKHLDILKEQGIHGVECHYSRYTDKESAMLREEAEKRNLLISGGSDFHGANKTVKIRELSADGTVVTSDKLTVLSEILKSDKVVHG